MPLASMPSLPLTPEEVEARRLTDEGRAAEKEGEYAAAAEKYLAAYRLHASAFRASRYVHVLRKQGAAQARDAVAFGLEALEPWGDDIWLRRELVWALYAAYLKDSEALEDDEHGYSEDAAYRSAIEAAARILSLTDEPLPTKLAVFSACKLAKRHGRWADVLELVDRLPKDGLSSEPQTIEGRTIPSDLERWHIARSRALFEVKRYREARQQCEEGLGTFPDSLALLRVAALARVEAGDIAGGREELERVVRRVPPQWYLYWDLGRIALRENKAQAALQWLAQAAAAQGDVRGKISLFDEMGKILEQMRRWDDAYHHYLLAWAIAEAEGWSGRAKRSGEAVIDFLSRHENDPGFDCRWIAEAPRVKDVLGKCRECWQAIGKEASPIVRARVTTWVADRGFGFLKLATGGPDLFFHGSQYRGPGQPVPGTEVECQVKDSFDPKRRRDSKVAVNIRPVSTRTPTAPAAPKASDPVKATVGNQPHGPGAEPSSAPVASGPVGATVGDQPHGPGAESSSDPVASGPIGATVGDQPHGPGVEPSSDPRASGPIGATVGGQPHGPGVEPSSDPRASGPIGSLNARPALDALADRDPGPSDQPENAQAPEPPANPRSLQLVDIDSLPY